MTKWALEIGLAILSLVLGLYFYFDKKRCRKNSEDFLDVWTHLEELQKDKERIDRQMTSLSKEVEMTQSYIGRQFSIIDSSQKELREFSMRQGEEIKDLIKDLASKIESYFGELHKLNVRVAQHIGEKNE